MNTSSFQEIQFSDTDFINPDDYVKPGDYNPHNVRPFLFHNHGYVCAIVFASCLDDALDIAADENKLEGFRVDECDLSDYSEDYSPACLGNCSEPYDLDCLGVIELPNPSLSFTALFNASKA